MSGGYFIDQAQLVDGGVVLKTFNFWDTDQTNGTVTGGSGVWEASTPNWTMYDASETSTWIGGTNTAYFTANAGTVTIANANSPSVGGLVFDSSGYSLSAAGTGTLQLSQDAKVAVISGGSATISAPIAGSYALIHNGPGTLLLSGNNTYTGATSVTGSELQLGAGGSSGSIAGTSGISLSSGASLSFNRSDAGLSLSTVISGAGAVRQLGSGTTTLTAANTYTGLTSVNAGRLVLSTTATGTRTATSGFAIASNATLQIDVASGQQFNSSSSYVTYTGGGTIEKTGAGLADLQWSSGARYALDSGAKIRLLGGVLRLAAGGPTDWSSNQSDLELASGTYFRLWDSDAIRIGALEGAGHFHKGWSSGITNAGVLTLGVNNKDGKFAGVVFDEGAPLQVIKVGTGTQTFTGAVNILNGLRIDKGTVQIGDGSSSVSSQTFTAGSGTSYTIPGGGNFTNRGSPVVLNDATAILAFNRGENGLTDSAIISGTGTVKNIGSGTVTLTGNHSYTGLTVITNGTLQIGAGGTTGTIASTSKVTVSQGALLAISRSDAQTFGKVIEGDGGLSKLGAGTLTLTANHTYKGPTTVSAGTLTLGATTGSTLDSATAVTVGSTATFNLNGKTQELKGALNSSGTLALGGGSLTLGAPTGQTVAHTVGAISGTGTITVGEGATLTLSTGLANTGVTIALAGGHLKLTNGQTYSLGTLNTAVNATASVDFGSSKNASLTVATLTLGSSSTLLASNWAAGTARFFVSTTVTSGSTVTRNLANIAPLNRVSLGGNDASLTYWRSSTGTDNNELLLASGTYTYWDPVTGNSTISGGVGTWDGSSPFWTTNPQTVNAPWQAGSNTAYFQTTGATVTVADGYVAKVGGLDFAVTGYTLAPGANATGKLELAQDATVTVASAATATINVPITGAYALSKSGAGVLILAGANTYTGATAVSAGTLRLTSPGSTAQQSAVTVSSGATLEGTGTLAGAVTVAGTLTPGVSGAGTITTGTLSLATTAVLAMDLDAPGGTGNDFVSVNGDLVLNTGATLSINKLAGFSTTGRYVLIKYTGNRSGAFSSHNLGNVAYQGVLEYDDTNKEVRLVSLPRVKISQVSGGGVGLFSFTLTGLDARELSLTTTTAGQAVSSSVLSGTIGTAATLWQRSPAGWPAVGQVSCLDANGAANGNGTGNLAVQDGATVTLSASAMRAGADITCAFTNTRNGITGVVFNDGGAPSAGSNTGTPNDGLKNGQEAGLGGVTVSVTNCSTITYDTTVTDSVGAYALNIPAAQIGQSVCVSLSLPTGWLATGANAAGTVLVSGTPATVGGVSLSYDRSKPQVAFTAPANGALALNFGQVPVSSFTADTTMAALPGLFAEHAQRFKAGTGGTLSVSLPAGAASPSHVSGWTAGVYLDANCSGRYQSGATLLSGGQSTTVTQGQELCMVTRVFVPAAAQGGHGYSQPVQAALAWSQSAPAISVTHRVTAATQVGASAVHLKKQVRNLTAGGSSAPWVDSNQARSGDELEYGITFTNTGGSAVTELTIQDASPAWTTWTQAGVDTVPSGLSCALHTPANPSPGTAQSCSSTVTGSGKGNLTWHFSGPLQPQASGRVLYRVKVD